MTIRPRKIPAYRLHKPTGQGVVRIDGHDHYLGKHGSEGSLEKYHRLIAEWLTAGEHCRADPVCKTTNVELKVNELLLAFLQHAKKHYRHPDGTPTREFDNFRDALRPVRRLYACTSASDFGPLALRALQQDMIKSGLCRTTINARIRRVRHVFKWATSLEIIPSTVVQALTTVPALQRGRCEAPESKGVSPVAWATVEATLPLLPRPVAAMVQLMRFSNCRAEDAVLMRACDLHMEGEVWTYVPACHKNTWRGQTRLVHLGPRAQGVIRPFLKPQLDAYLFDPRDALREHHQGRRARRKTKRTLSESVRQCQEAPQWQPRERYSVNTFQQAVRRACRRAGLPAWSVLQIRHSRGTEVRELYGVEGAASSLGHQRVETSQIYAEKSEQLARRIAREIG